MDIIRVVATIAVILIHVSATILYRTSIGSMSFNLSLIINQLSRFSVPAFILISGMGLSISYKKEQSYFKFIRHRFAKIIPQYGLWCLIYIFLVTKNFNLHTVIKDMVYGKVFYHFYFVPLIIEFYILFPFVYKFISKKYFVFTSLFATLSFLFFSHYVKMSAVQGGFLEKKNLIYWIFYFSLGSFIGENLEEFYIKVHKYKKIIFILFLVSTLGILYESILNFGYNKDIEYCTTFLRPSILAYTVCFVLFIFSIEFKQSFFIKIIKYISKNSYHIYLSHALILYYYTDYCIKRSISINNLHFGIKAFIITLFFSMLINELKKII